MAGLPPRSRSRSSSSTRKDRSPLETLQLMGFPQERAEKAIAATGNRGIQLASDWLLSHVNDPLLDNHEPREYIIYLCPTGKLLENLVNYWDKSIHCCGWNSAHIYHPHITLCAFFKIPNNKVDVIDAVMNVANQEISKWPSVGRLGLDFYTQNKNFIGYFVKSPHHLYIEQLMIRVQDEFIKHGIEMKPQMKQLHLTLAFQYDASQHDVLMKMAQEININCSTTWEMRIFSRNLALKTAEVRRVIKHYKPAQADELELTEGDYVYMEPEEHENSPDGWFKGTSWRTGVCAFFPGNFTVKCSQMEMWTLHRFAAAPSLSAINEIHNGLDNAEPMDTAEPKVEDYDNIWFSKENGQTDIYAKVNKPKTVQNVKPRKLLVVRHAERCDFAFPRIWFDKSFSSDGEYRRFNLNCPKSVAPRSSFKDYNKDCPLTLMGIQQARITGDALRDAGEVFSYVYCSPALRCVETATEIIRGSGSNCDIFIEPSLFEWCGWYKPTLPNFMVPQELVKNGFPVDMSYNAYVNIQNIRVYETVEEYYTRSHNFTQHVLRKHKPEGANILLIGHSGTLDACTRQLQCKPQRNYESFLGIVRGVPYCCICTATEDPSTGKWALIEPSIPPFAHGANKPYSWKDLLE